MALELIDGYAGTPHISSDDLAALNVGCFGEGDYVFDYGDDLAATMTTSNKVTIGTGALVSNGRRSVNLSPQQLTVQSGTQGQKRNDIVVARYSKASGTNIESASFVVVKGTPVSYGKAADPSVGQNDMKLWRIPIDGITPGTPVKLFEQIPSINGLRDFVSRDPVFIYETSSPKTISPGLSGTFEISPSIPDGYQIAAFRRVSTNHVGSGSITAFSSGGKNVSVTVYNFIGSSVSFTVSVDILCLPR